jgi:uncharacterized membrane protein
MYHWFFLWRLNQKRVVQAIRAAEQRTSGELRVFVSHKKCPDPMAEAKAQFVKLGMHRTQLRNGLLIFVAPRSQTFALLADTGVHEQCQEQIWQQAAEKLSAALAAGQLTEGLVRTLQTMADILAQHFPREGPETNELPDEVVTG